MNEQEPSMEDILSSIRNILSEDTKTEKLNVENNSSVNVVETNPKTETLNQNDQVIDLTEDMMVKKSIPDNYQDDKLISDDAENATKNSLMELAEKVRNSNTTNKFPFGDTSATLEDMVKEMMRPLLKEWLDENLPEIVEKVVRKEIKRVTDNIDI